MQMDLQCRQAHHFQTRVWTKCKNWFHGSRVIPFRFLLSHSMSHLYQFGYSIYRRVLDYYTGEEDAFDMRKAMIRDKDKTSIIPLKKPIYPHELEFDWSFKQQGTFYFLAFNECSFTFVSSVCAPHHLGQGCRKRVRASLRIQFVRSSFLFSV